MDIILKGKAVVQKIDEEGSILTIDSFSDGDFLGANLIFSSTSLYPMTVISEFNTWILHMDKELILKLCKNNLGFMEKLLMVISDRTQILTNKINTLSLKTIRECIMDFLRYEYHIQKSNTIKLNLSKKELAERFGVQRSSLSRELDKMRKDGLVDYDSKTITIKNINI